MAWRTPSSLVKSAFRVAAAQSWSVRKSISGIRLSGIWSTLCLSKVFRAAQASAVDSAIAPSRAVWRSAVTSPRNREMSAVPRRNRVLLIHCRQPFYGFVALSQQFLCLPGERLLLSTQGFHLGSQQGNLACFINARPDGDGDRSSHYDFLSAGHSDGGGYANSCGLGED